MHGAADRLVGGHVPHELGFAQLAVRRSRLDPDLESRQRIRPERDFGIGGQAVRGQAQTRTRTLAGEDLAGGEILEDHFLVPGDLLGAGNVRVESLPGGELEPQTVDEVVQLRLLLRVRARDDAQDLEAVRVLGDEVVLALRAGLARAAAERVECVFEGEGHLIGAAQLFFERLEEIGRDELEGRRDDDRFDVAEGGQRNLGGAEDLSETVIEPVRFAKTTSLHRDDRDAALFEHARLVLPVELALVLHLGCRVRNFVADHDHDAFASGLPLGRTCLVQNELVAFGSVTSAGRLDASHEIDHLAAIVREIEETDDARAVTVVPVRDDADAQTGHRVEEPRAETLDVGQHLVEHRVHRAGGVEGDQQIESAFEIELELRHRT